MTPYYTTAEAAQALGLHKQTLYNAYQKQGHYRGVKPYKTLNTRLHWSKDEVQALLRKHAAEQGVQA